MAKKQSMGIKQFQSSFFNRSVFPHSIVCEFFGSIFMILSISETMIDFYFVPAFSVTTILKSLFANVRCSRSVALPRSRSNQENLRAEGPITM